MKPVYLDHAATTPVDERVMAAMLPHFSKSYGNASELHTLGRAARQAIDEARAQVAAGIGASGTEIVFTSGGTEADNLAIIGYLRELPPAHLIVSAIEHAAVLESARALQRTGWDVDYIPVDGEGVVDVEAYTRAFRPDTKLVSIHLANNVVGTIEPVRELTRIAHERGVPVHTDAVQAVGAIPVDVRDLGVDMLSLSAHKLYGPKGSGALYVRRGVRLRPLLFGGGHERRLRSGTENVPGIVGLGAAIELAVAGLHESQARLAALRDRLVAGVMDLVPDVRYLGHPTQRLPGNAAFTVRYVEGESMLLHLDTRGYMVASGSACASGALQPSHVVMALGADAEDAHGSLRLTLGRATTDDDIDGFLAVFPGIVARLRAMSPLFLKD
ncbi:MAG: cysteine desulfurase family protein [Thermoleophilia bacterium]